MANKIKFIFIISLLIIFNSLAFAYTKEDIQNFILYSLAYDSSTNEPKYSTIQADVINFIQTQDETIYTILDMVNNSNYVLFYVAALLV